MAKGEVQEELTAFEKELPIVLQTGQAGELPLRAAERPAQSPVSVPDTDLAQRRIAAAQTSAMETPDWLAPQSLTSESHAPAPSAGRGELIELKDEVGDARGEAKTARDLAVAGGALNYLYTRHEKGRAKRTEAGLAEKDQRMKEVIEAQKLRLDRQQGRIDRLEQPRLERAVTPLARLAAERGYVREVAQVAREQASITREARQVVEEQIVESREGSSREETVQYGAAATLEQPPKPQETSSQPLWSEQRFAEHIEKGPGMADTESNEKVATAPSQQDTTGAHQASASVEPAQTSASAPTVTPSSPQKTEVPEEDSSVPHAPPQHLIAYVIVLAVALLCLGVLLVTLAR
jgi:hypothetical protein